MLGAALVAALAIPGYASAHDGPHKVMGTVATLHENHLEVKATDGKTSTTITLNEKTKILRGKAKVKVGDITPGERVVVTAIETKGKDGKVTMVATEIRLGTTNTTAPK